MSNSLEETLAALRDEFVFSASSMLDEMESHVSGVTQTGSGAVSLKTIRQPLMIQAHNLKGSGGSFGFPLITSVAHRLEDFLSELPDDTDTASAELLMPFFDTIRDTLDGRFTDDQHAEVLKSLPTPRDVHHAQVSKIDLQVLMVFPSRTLTEIIRRSFEGAGAAVSCTRFAVEGLGLAIKNKPDLLVLAGVLDGVSGLDIARAVISMEATGTTTPVIVSSQLASEQGRSLLPKRVRIIPQNRQLSDNIKELCDRAMTAKSKASTG